MVCTPVRLRAIPRRSETSRLRRLPIRKLDAIVVRYVIVIRTSRPMINVAPLVPAHRSIVCAHGPVFWWVEAQSALCAVAEVLWLHRMSISPQS